MRQQFPDAVVLPGATALPPATDLKRKKIRIPVSKPRDRGEPGPRRGETNCAGTDPETHVRPQINVATQDARWFSLCRVDGVTVTTADGRGVVYRQRDRAKMFALLRASLRQQLRVVRQFDRMRKVYREALPVLTSTQKWETVLLTESAEKTDMTDAPRGEDAVLVAVQSALASRPGVLNGARALSHFGEHSLGWLAVAAAGGAGPAGQAKVMAGRGCRCLHGPCRRRPDQAGGAPGAAAPSRYRGQRRDAEPAEFPVGTCHFDDGGRRPAGLTTGLPLRAVLVVPMALSRLVLGVHYPTDVLTGVAVGTLVGSVVGRTAGVGAEGDCGR